MAEFGGVRLVQNAESQMQKAEALEKIVTDMVNKITEIDEEITVIIRGGITSESVREMLKTYLKNREVISGFVKQCAMTANVLYESADALKRNEERASIAAGGGV